MEFPLNSRGSENTYYVTAGLKQQVSLLETSRVETVLIPHLKALVFLYAFEESVDCHLLSSFCDDSNLHISLFKYVLSTIGVTKESISKFSTVVSHFTKS